jgi:hypothetical protein
LFHLYQTSSLLPGHLPIVASASLRLPYLLLYSEYIIHIQVLGFLPFPYSFHVLSPLSCDPCPIILLHLFWVYNPHMRENMWFLVWAWLTSLKMMFSLFIILRKKKNALIIFSNFKTYYSAIAIKSLWYWHKDWHTGY